MQEPGDRPPHRPSPARDPGHRQRVPAGTATTPSRQVVLGLALGIVALAAVTWALLRGVLELSIGLLALAAVGGWGVGAVLRPAIVSRPLAAGLGALAWLLGLVLTWLLAMAILPDSTRTFIERLEATPFPEWLAPQFGFLEIAALLLYVGGALYAQRRPMPSA